MYAKIMTNQIALELSLLIIKINLRKWRVLGQIRKNRIIRIMRKIRINEGPMYVRERTGISKWVLETLTIQYHRESMS